MDLLPLFKSVIDQDRCPVVLCGLDHTILYMNPASAARYARSGGAALVGRSIFDCHNARSQELICQVLDWFRQDMSHNKVYTFRSDKENKDVYMVALRDGDGTLIGYYEKHEYRDRETAGLYDTAP